MRMRVLTWPRELIRNACILCSGIQHPQVGPGLNDPRLVNALVPTLLNKWESLGPGNKDVLPLLECLHSIVGALGSGFQPYAEMVFARCVAQIDATLAARRPDGELEKDFIVSALDMLCVLVEALGPSVEPLVARSSLREVIFPLHPPPGALTVTTLSLCTSFEYITFSLSLSHHTMLCSHTHPLR